MKQSSINNADIKVSIINNELYFSSTGGLTYSDSKTIRIQLNFKKNINFLKKKGKNN